MPRASHPLPGGLRREGSRAQKTPSALRQTRRPVPHGSATAIAARPARRRPPTAAAIATATAGNGRRARPLEPRPARSDWLFPPNYESLNAPREGRRDYSSQSALRRLRRGRCKMAAGGEEGRAAEPEPEPAAEPEVAAEEPRSFKDLVSPGWSRFCPCCSLRRPAYPAGGSSSHSPVWQAVQAAGGPRPGGAAGSRGGGGGRLMGRLDPWASCRAWAGGLGSSGLCSGEVGLAALLCAAQLAGCIFSCVNLPRCFPVSVLVGYPQRGRETAGGAWKDPCVS